jgi:hypothetical protein
LLEHETDLICRRTVAPASCSSRFNMICGEMDAMQAQAAASSFTSAKAANHTIYLGWQIRLSAIALHLFTGSCRSRLCCTA